MKSGVLKSGSPRLRFMTSTPLALRSRLRCDIAMVADSAKFSMRSESIVMRLIKSQN